LLVTLTYVKLSPVYADVEQFINLEFSNLHINMNRETLVKLIDFSTKFATSTPTAAPTSQELTAPAKATEVTPKDSSVTTIKVP
jgi:hypothetical protein